jgi:hypothetical protein
VLAFTGLQHDAALTESCKACLSKLDKTYLLDFLVLFNIQQQNGRTFNRRHAPGSLVSALVEHLDKPGEHYMEVQRMITSKERPVRSNRNTATLNEDGLDPMGSMAGGGPPDSPSEEEEEEWGLPEASSSGKKRRHNGGNNGESGSGGGGGGGGGSKGEGKDKASRNQSPASNSPSVSRRRGGGNSAASKPPSVPLRSNPPRTPTLSHAINYNVNQNFSALTSALQHSKTTYVRGSNCSSATSGGANGAGGPASKPKRAKAEEKVTADLWVACDVCEKWRLLPPGTYESEDKIPASWQCNMYPTARYNDCSIPEETAATAPEEELVVIAPKKQRASFVDPVSIDMQMMQVRLAEEARLAAEYAAAQELEDELYDGDDEDVAMADAMPTGSDGVTSNSNSNNNAVPAAAVSQWLASAAAAALEEDGGGSVEAGVNEGRFVLADVVATDRPFFNHTDVPPFFRGRVGVYKDKQRLGELLLTEKETVWDVRCKIAQEWLNGREGHVVLLKRGEIPIHESQNHKLAYWFLEDPSDFLEVRE